MVIKCCVALCTTRFDRKPGGVMMHRFPRCNIRKVMWADFVRNVNGTSWHPSDSSFVCSAHFEPGSWEVPRQDGKLRLRHNAVPSVSCTRPARVSHCQTPEVLGQIENVSPATRQACAPAQIETPSTPQDHSYMGRRKVLGQIENVSPATRQACAPAQIETPSIPQDHSYMGRRKVLGRIENVSPATRQARAPAQIETPSVPQDHSYMGRRNLFHEMKNVSLSTTPPCVPVEMDDSGLQLLLDCLEPELRASGTKTDAPNSPSLTELVDHVETDISVNHTKESEIDSSLTAVLHENEQLKKEMAKVTQIAERMCKQNVTLRQSYRKLSDKYRSLRDIHKRTEEGLKNVFGEDQFKALSRTLGASRVLYRVENRFSALEL